MVNGSLERCHFPFQVGNRKYTECAPKNGKFFCQTGRRPNEWGYCLPSTDEYLEKYDKFNLIITNNGNSDQGLKALLSYFSPKINDEMILTICYSSVSLSLQIQW